ncbi:MAG: diguanylate cyclase domain-containing protein, partial [Gaiellaceae bacterium]
GFDGITEALMRELCLVLEVDQVHLQMISQDRSLGRARVMCPGAEEGPAIVAEYVQALRPDRPSGVRTVVETGQPLSVFDAGGREDLHQENVERWDARGMLLQPLVFGGNVRAVLVLVSRAPREFTASEIELAGTLANQAAAGIALREVEHRRRIELEQQTALARAAKAVSASLDLREVLTALSREAVRATDSDYAGVYLADGTGGGIAAAGHHKPRGWLGSRIGPGEGVGGRILVTGEAVITNDYQGEVDVPDIDGFDRLQTAAGVPIRWEGQLKGALSVGFERMRRVTGEDIEVLEAIAELAAMACRNAETYERARLAARTDSLTGALNHGAMQVRLREEIERSRRTGEPLACLLIDLDNFKALNDGAGHLVGDQVLRRVATALAREFRPTDQLARYGGDEFVLILPGVAEEKARETAERVRTSIRDAAAPLVVSGTPLASSVGIALWHEPLGAAELLERADRALLLSKRTGKDRVAVASLESERALATLLGGSGSPSDLMRDFWSMVTGCESPREAITTLPSFARRVLGLEEAALYELAAGSAEVLHRTAGARLPGDPGTRGFVRASLTLDTNAHPRVSGAAIARGRLAELHEALGIYGRDLDRRAPPGAYAAVPLVGPDRLHAILFLRTAESPFPLARLQQAEMLGRQALTVLLGQSEDGSAAAVKALAATIDARDNYTHDHSEEVVALASRVAQLLGLPLQEVERVRTGALLHDVGKVAIPNEILYKSGGLTDAEWEIMRQHPVIGERILRRTPELADVASLVRHEHEHWDGTGYPDGISGTDIPVASRIILACDAYNAMITRRPYRDPMTHLDAIEELRRGSRTQFDPTVVEALVRVLAERS